MRRLKADRDGTLVIFGSGELVRSLVAARLLDELVLMIHPIVLGQGFRLFDGAPPADFQVSDPLVAKTGLVAGRYRLA